jgi:hypothetical protein
MKETKIATTVKIPSELYDELKVLGVRHKISLQTLVEKCINLFVSNTQVSASFRETVTKFSVPKRSESIVIQDLSGSVTPQ